LAIAEKINASIGVLVIRKNKITWDETGRTVLCYQCMRKTNEDDEICTKDEKPIHEFHWTGQSLAFLTPSLFGQLVSRPIYLVD
jgi:hypothetical protein